MKGFLKLMCCSNLQLGVQLCDHFECNWLLQVVDYVAVLRCPLAIARVNGRTDHIEMNLLWQRRFDVVEELKKIPTGCNRHVDIEQDNVGQDQNISGQYGEAFNGKLCCRKGGDRLALVQFA